MENKQASLFVGGTRSGKSSLALHHAEMQSVQNKSAASCIFVATAKGQDNEMQKRILAHQAERQERDFLWHCVELPLLKVQELQKIEAEGSVILIDCLSLWLSNMLENMNDAEIFEHIMLLKTWALQCSVPLVMVSNEVGQGMVPMNALARRFSDNQGLLNQHMAQICAHVFFVSCGLPMTLKGKTSQS